ncbi:hypothetical protein Cs7R123_06990 [Catellatospora sp. TT07R-123]|uniref:hypothetical protein n=1 Tax=Catellatospora sp. TT07R-123 TaxID=2733863 RepID=UPI001B1026B1|nr:hypothetical protein [Catellatospora sp. TT07R-123]GHJ43357.1 hypothetical protein Cs7R123_06990 [Catellatospora sp. TT07R-123]
MSGEVRADPVELARVAQSCLDGSQDLAAALRSVRADTVLSTSDFGNVASAASVSEAYHGVEGIAGTAVERLGAVLEVDNESLLRVAFAYQQADEEAERKLRQKYHNIPI